MSTKLDTHIKSFAENVQERFHEDIRHQLSGQRTGAIATTDELIRRCSDLIGAVKAQTGVNAHVAAMGACLVSFHVVGDTATADPQIELELGEKAETPQELKDAKGAEVDPDNPFGVDVGQIWKSTDPRRGHEIEVTTVDTKRGVAEVINLDSDRAGKINLQSFTCEGEMAQKGWKLTKKGPHKLKRSPKKKEKGDADDGGNASADAEPDEAARAE